MGIRRAFQNSASKFALELKAADTVHIGRSHFLNIFKCSLLGPLYDTRNRQVSCIFIFDIMRSFQPVHEMKAF
jgi:hypothetical protein